MKNGKECISGLVFLAEYHTGIICYKTYKSNFTNETFTTVRYIFNIYGSKNIVFAGIPPHRHFDNKIHHKY
jgi:hypothetical protein